MTGPSLHPRLRPAILALLAAGVVLAVLGVVGDAAGFWSRFPFLTNLASAVTGALFGIPVAVVVVQRLLQVQTEANERAAAWRLALRSAHHMRLAAGELSTVDPSAEVARGDAALAEARAWADRAFHAKPRPRRLRASMYQRAYLRQVLILHESAQRVANAAAETAASARIRAEARFLLDHVRPMVLRLGGAWLPEPRTRALENLATGPPATDVDRLLAAVPAAEIAAVLPEADVARADLPDPDLPLPLPPLDRLTELRAAIDVLAARTAEKRRVGRVVDEIEEAIDRLSG